MANMKKIGRLVLAIALAIIGVGATIFGTLLLLQGGNWMLIGFSLSTILFGVASIASAWAVAKGDNIRDIIQMLLFIGLP